LYVEWEDFGKESAAEAGTPNEGELVIGPATPSATPTAEICMTEDPDALLAAETPDVCAIAADPSAIDAVGSLPPDSNVAPTEAPSANCSGSPLCSEPWNTMYALNRGIFPCCYGHKPIARWDERGEKSVEQFLGDVFHGAKFQELRSELAAGQMPNYCRNTQNCPVLHRLKRENPSALGASQAAPAAPATSLPIVQLDLLQTPMQCAVG
jgi:hypothetical protein